MPITKSKALVVLSGGQDSTTCLLWAKARYDEVHAVSFHYGQRHGAELLSAAKIATMCQAASHVTLNVSGLLLGRSPLVNPAAELETYSDPATMAATIGERVELTFVPLRNLLFLVIAANKALALDCYDVVVGVCEEDNANYPDCTEAFLDESILAVREALGMHRADYTGPTLRFVAPLLHKTKAQTVALAKEVAAETWEAIMAESHTCYAGATPPCGKCHACVLRADGFAKANTVDPLVEKWARIKAWLIEKGYGDMTLGDLARFEADWMALPQVATGGVA